MLNPCVINKFRTALISSSKLSTATTSITDSPIISKQNFPKKKNIYKVSNSFDEDFLQFTRQYFSVNENDDILKIEFKDSMQKFSYLTQCQMKFNKAITNSYLADMRTVKNVLQYMKKDVKSPDSLENLSKMKHVLPKNLFIQKDPVMFDPRTDSMFGGISAYPNRDRVMVHLEAQKKYPSIKSVRTRKVEIESQDLY